MYHKKVHLQKNHPKARQEAIKQCYVFYGGGAVGRGGRIQLLTWIKIRIQKSGSDIEPISNLYSNLACEVRFGHYFVALVTNKGIPEDILQYGSVIHYYYILGSCNITKSNYAFYCNKVVFSQCSIS